MINNTSATGGPQSAREHANPGLREAREHIGKLRITGSASVCLIRELLFSRQGARAFAARIYAFKCVCTSERNTSCNRKITKRRKLSRKIRLHAQGGKGKKLSFSDIDRGMLAALMWNDRSPMVYG